MRRRSSSAVGKETNIARLTRELSEAIYKRLSTNLNASYPKKTVQAKLTSSPNIKATNATPLRKFGIDAQLLERFIF